MNNYTELVSECIIKFAKAVISSKQKITRVDKLLNILCNQYRNKTNNKDTPIELIKILDKDKYISVITLNVLSALDII